jgi:pimeloyl-ACP methyl ester carboxylesterase
METEETKPYDLQHTLENGIERVICTPRQRRFKTPILMMHGMWHGAWCWRHWQELLATWGWESHAFSLPGHAGSPVQRPVYFCTMGYYLRVLQAEVERLPRKPILMGHSMGGALTQWYLRFVGDDLPAGVLVAPWDSHKNIAGRDLWWQLDPIGLLLVSFTLWTGFYIRSPEQAARKLLSPKSIYTPEELHGRLSPESGWVMVQHNPPFWHPPEQVNTPLLWLAGESDAVISVEHERRSADHYQADFVVIPEAAHNIMMEYNYRETAEIIHDWLDARGIT